MSSSPTSSSGSSSGDKVVSVRIDNETCARLDRLCQRTGRSRGFYLRMAIRAMLPVIEEQHWKHQAAQFEDSIIDREFREIMTEAFLPRPNQGNTGNEGPTGGQ